MKDDLNTWLRRCHGLALRALRLRAGLSRAQLAEAIRKRAATTGSEVGLGASHQLVGTWELGRRRPTLAMAWLLAPVFKVEYTELVNAGLPFINIKEGTDPDEVLRRVGLPRTGGE